jgi:hypothetical protein
MAKRNREQAVREKRELKLAKKHAAAIARNAPPEEVELFGPLAENGRTRPMTDNDLPVSAADTDLPASPADTDLPASPADTDLPASPAEGVIDDTSGS